jgi:hypothetical protein
MLKAVKIGDLVFLLEHGSIVKTVVIRTTSKQVQIENGDKFWKSSGFRVGDTSASRAVVYPITHGIVSELYQSKKDIYRIVEWIHQLKATILQKKNSSIQIEEVKPLLDELYKLISSYE